MAKTTNKALSPEPRKKIVAGIRESGEAGRNARETRLEPHRELIRTILFEAFDNGNNYQAAIDILLTMRRATDPGDNGVRDDFAEALFDINWALDDALFGGDLAEMAGLSHD
jgi:hypothetical protein